MGSGIRHQWTGFLSEKELVHLGDDLVIFKELPDCQKQAFVMSIL